MLINLVTQHPSNEKPAPDFLMSLKGAESVWRLAASPRVAGGRNIIIRYRLVPGTD
jgi:hypothetical protein